MPAESVVSVTEGDPSNSALGTLRERTRELHTRLEDAIDINVAISSVSSYIHLLCGYLNIYASFEAELHRQDSPIREVVSQIYQSRVSSLERDLRSLGVEPNHYCKTSASIPLPNLGHLDSVFGALYVVEGASLGGQIIYREIQQKLSMDADSGAGFFFGNGEQTGPAWKRFTSLLNQSVSQPERAADAAAAMFRAFEYGLQQTGEGGPTI